MRRAWLPKINLLHHITTYIPRGIPNHKDEIFLKEFQHSAPLKIMKWPDMPDYGDVEDREKVVDGFVEYTG